MASRTASAPWPAGQVGHLLGQGSGYDIGGVTLGQADEHHEPARAFDQGGHGAHALAEEQVAFPVAGHRPVLGLGGSLTDVDGASELAAPDVGELAGGPAGHSSAAQIPGQFPA